MQPKLKVTYGPGNATYLKDKTYRLMESVVLSRGWSLIGFWVCVGPVSTKKSAKIVRIAGDWKKGKKFTTLGLVAATVNDW